MGTKWIGTDGWVWVDRGGFDASNPGWVKGDSLPEELRKVKLYESDEHRRNFLDCVKSRKPTITPVETAHHSTHPRPSRPHLHAGRPQDPVGCREGKDPQRPRRQRTALAPLSRSLEVPRMKLRAQIEPCGD